jgi:hypothetical protein
VWRVKEDVQCTELEKIGGIVRGITFLGNCPIEGKGRQTEDKSLGREKRQSEIDETFSVTRMFNR